MYRLVTSEVCNCKVYFVIESIKDPLNALLVAGERVYCVSSRDVGSL